MLVPEADEKVGDAILAAIACQCLAAFASRFFSIFFRSEYRTLQCRQSSPEERMNMPQKNESHVENCFDLRIW